MTAKQRQSAANHWTHRPLRRDAPNAAPAAAPARWQDSSLRRAVALDSAPENDAREIPVAFSSDVPLLRFGDYEILSHAPGACDLTRLNDGGIVLFNHNRDDYIGSIVPGSARIEGNVARATLRLADSERGNRILADIKAGILRQVSVAYNVLEWLRSKGGAGMPDSYTATRWQPYEISIVTVAADPSVGIGRSQISTTNTNNQSTDIMNRSQLIAALTARAIKFDANATDEQLRALLDAAPAPAAPANNPPAAPAPRSEPAAPAPAAAPASAAARAQVTDLLDLADAYIRAVPNARELAATAIRQGHDVTAFQRTLLDTLNQRNQTALTESANIGLSDTDARRFSFLRLIRAAASTGADRRDVEDAAFELEVCATAARTAARNGRNVRGLLIPDEVLRVGRRDAVSVGAGTGLLGTGNNLVETHLMVGSFIEMLHNRSVFVRNTTPLTGLQGTLSFPKQASAATAGWVGEDVPANQSGATFAADALAHKTVAARSRITRDMLNQPSMDVEAFVKADLARACAEAIDVAGFYGSGSDTTPKGIKNVSGVSAVAFGGTALTYAKLVEMETAIATGNADIGAMKYIINAAQRGQAKTTKKFPGDATSAVLWEPGNTLNGYATDVTNTVKAADILFGVWSEILFAQWGGIDLLAERDVDNGSVKTSIFQDVNFYCRRPECFAIGALTA